MVKTRRRIVLLISLMCTAAVIASAGQVAVSLSYVDKAIYVPGSDVFVKFTISNESGQAYRFKLAENRMFSVDLQARTLANQLLPPARQFTTERTSNQQLYYRDVAIEPGEQFSFVENLKDYVDLAQTGVFIVSATFYPELIEGNPTLPASNTLSLTIQPDLGADQMVGARIDQATGAILERAALPPDEVVAYALHGLQDGAWNRFLLYFDQEGLLLSSPTRSREYRRLSADAQRDRLAQFIVQVEKQLEDPQLSAVPTDFSMVRTTYDQDQATVIMDLKFQHPGFTEVKRYTYFLRRTDSVWYIYDYAVTNLATE